MVLKDGPSDGTSTDLMFETGLISTGDGTTFTQSSEQLILLEMSASIRLVQTLPVSVYCKLQQY